MDYSFNLIYLEKNMNFFLYSIYISISNIILEIPSGCNLHCIINFTNVAIRSLNR